MRSQNELLRVKGLTRKSMINLTFFIFLFQFKMKPEIFLMILKLYSLSYVNYFIRNCLLFIFFFGKIITILFDIKMES
jgi:hypothetical protein